MGEHSAAFKELLDNIIDQGLHSALACAGEGWVAFTALDLNKKLQDAGYALTTYGFSKREHSGAIFHDRRWAVYNKADKRPHRYIRCLYYSNTFPNIMNRKTKNCGAYIKLLEFEKLLIVNGLIKKTE